jgi:hypothetical protein
VGAGVGMPVMVVDGLGCSSSPTDAKVDAIMIPHKNM